MAVGNCLTVNHLLKLGCGAGTGLGSSFEAPGLALNKSSMGNCLSLAQVVCKLFYRGSIRVSPPATPGLNPGSAEIFPTA